MGPEHPVRRVGRISTLNCVTEASMDTCQSYSPQEAKLEWTLVFCLPA